jgi:hypothetical protein
VHKPLEYVRQSFPDAVGVGQQLVIAASVVKGLEGAIEEACLSRAFLDVAPVLPPILSHGAYVCVGVRVRVCLHSE